MIICFPLTTFICFQLGLKVGGMMDLPILGFISKLNKENKGKAIYSTMITVMDHGILYWWYKDWLYEKSMRLNQLMGGQWSEKLLAYGYWNLSELETNIFFNVIIKSRF